MPKNRMHIPREERVDAIIDVAEELFVANGYAKTSVSAVGGGAGVANAAIHWYFPTKDDLFAAVLERLLLRVQAQPLPDDPAERLGVVLEELEAYRPLHADVHQRLGDSEALVEFHERLHDWLDVVVLDAATVHGTVADPDLLRDAVRAVMEGGTVLPPNSRPFPQLVRYVLDSVNRAAAT